jgi:hypothetical protein
MYFENELEKNYEDTRNPLFAWFAYSSARYHGRLVPEWVLKYFDEAAKELALLAYIEDKPEREEVWGKRRIDAVISRAMGFKKGRGTPFADYVRIEHKYLPGTPEWQKREEDFATALMVHEAKTSDPKRPLEDIFMDVGEQKDLSESMVKALYYQFKDEIADKMKEDEIFFGETGLIKDKETKQT